MTPTSTPRPISRGAAHETPRFLGLIPGVIYDYEVFNRYVLEKDLQRIERYYRARGYYRARAQAARVVFSGKSARGHFRTIARLSR